MEFDHLSEEEYEILRKKGTEPAFSGKYVDNDKEGNYLCKGCGSKLFSSDKKFKSGTGWPSFYDAEGVEFREDRSHGMVRTEVVCSKCKSHLGHFFEDGPHKKRYCVNSLALDFKKT